MKIYPMNLSLKLRRKTIRDPDATPYFLSLSVSNSNPEETFNQLMGEREPGAHRAGKLISDDHLERRSKEVPRGNFELVADAISEFVDSLVQYSIEEDDDRETNTLTIAHSLWLYVNKTKQKADSLDQEYYEAIGVSPPHPESTEEPSNPFLHLSNDTSLWLSMLKNGTRDRLEFERKNAHAAALDTLNSTFDNLSQVTLVSSSRFQPNNSADNTEITMERCNSIDGALRLFRSCTRTEFIGSRFSLREILEVANVSKDWDEFKAKMGDRFEFMTYDNLKSRAGGDPDSEVDDGFD